MEDRLALASVLAFTLGILLASLGVVSVPVLFFVLLLALVCFIAWFLHGRTSYWFPILILLFLAVGAGRTLLTPTNIPKAFVPFLDTSVTLSGTIVGDPDLRETNQRITVAIEEGGQQTKIIAVVDRYETFSYGDMVTVSGKVELPQAFDTDGERTFNYPMFLAKDGVFALIPKASLTKTGEDPSVLVRSQRLLYDGKHAFIRGMQNALPEPHASLAAGLLTGGKQGLGDQLLEAFTISGLLPIIVLSGYNVMIVAESVMAGLAFLPRRIGIVVAGITISLFVLAAGGGSSALRAGVMAVLALFARITGRTYDALRALLAVLVLMLLLNPLSLVYDPGFQFSFVATLGLILFSPLLEARLTKIKPNALRDVVATTCAAQLFVLPLLLYQTGNLSLVAIAANVVTLPFIPLTMLLSFVSGIIGILIPTIAPVLGVPAYLLLAGIIGVAEWSASLPFAHLIIPSFSGLLLIPAYALVALLVWRLRLSPSTTATQ